MLFRLFIYHPKMMVVFNSSLLQIYITRKFAKKRISKQCEDCYKLYATRQIFTPKFIIHHEKQLYITCGATRLSFKRKKSFNKVYLWFISLLHVTEFEYWPKLLAYDDDDLIALLTVLNLFLLIWNHTERAKGEAW